MEDAAQTLGEWKGGRSWESYRTTLRVPVASGALDPPAGAGQRCPVTEKRRKED